MFLVDQSHDKFISKIRGFEDKELLFLPKYTKAEETFIEGTVRASPLPPPPTSDCFEVAREQALLRQESRRAMQACKRSAKGAHV